MNEYLEEIENVIMQVIDNETGNFFDEFRERLIERLNEID